MAGMTDDRWKKAAAAMKAGATLTNTRTIPKEQVQEVGVNKTNPAAAATLAERRETPTPRTGSNYNVTGGGDAARKAFTGGENSNNPAVQDARQKQHQQWLARQPTGPPPSMGPRTTPASAPAKPKLISYETNPNMDWRQAAALNQQAMQNYGNESVAGIRARSDMDTAVQHGMNQMASTVQSGRNQMGVARQQGESQVAATRARGAEDRKTGQFNRTFTEEDWDKNRAATLEDQASKQGLDTYLKTGSAATAGKVQNQFGGQVDYGQVSDFTPQDSWDVSRAGGSSDDPTYRRINRKTGQYYDEFLEALRSGRKR